MTIGAVTLRYYCYLNILAMEWAEDIEIIQAGLYCTLYNQVHRLLELGVRQSRKYTIIIISVLNYFTKYEL